MNILWPINSIIGHIELGVFMPDLKIYFENKDEKEAHYQLNTFYTDKIMLKFKDGTYVITSMESFRESFDNEKTY